MDLLEKVKIQVIKIEDRENDSWLDMSLRSIRKGEVHFYRVNDPLTGKWLFKVCSDDEMHRSIIKALKCPPGIGFVQLEGRTMLFQRSLVEGYYYDVISVSYLDQDERLRRNVVATLEEVPETIRGHFKVVGYEEATGKKAIGKSLVVLCEEKDEKKMITMFLIQRAWPISQIPPDAWAKSFDLLRLIRNLERAEIDEIYRSAEEQYALTKEDANLLLRFLETEGKILVSEGHIKTRR